MSKILLIGPLPEPKGGVSIHIQRLSKLLSYKHNIVHIDESPILKKNIFNIRSLIIFKYFDLIYKSNIVHIHSSIDILRIFHIIFAKIFGKKIILTIHSWRNKSVKKEKLLLLLFNYVDKIIVVNKDIAIKLELKNYSVKAAFIPPENEELKSLPKDLEEIIRLKKNKNFIIASSNAYQLIEYNGEDLYGLDLFLHLAQAFRERKILFIFQLASLKGKGSSERYERYIKLIKDEKLNNIIFYVKPISFVALINKSDVTLRLTNTDGDALSIRESLYLSTPIIASNVVDRPKGTILFNTRDVKDLLNVFGDTYERLISGNEFYKNSQNSNLSFINFYNKIYFE